LTISAHLRYPVIKRALASIPDAETVTEIGTGSGAMACRFVAAGYDYLGFESDAESFRVTQQALVGCGAGQLHNSFLPQDPIRQSDVVVAFEVLEHIEDHAGALRDWIRWVKPGGLVLISVPAHQHRFGEWDAAVGHFRRYERDQLISLLEEAGFVRVEVRSVGFPAGMILESIRNRRATPMGATIEEQTAASGRHYQPTRRSAWLTASAAFPFHLVQQAFERTDFGTGYVVWARRPAD
jgi:SAM-dependent methyltransferase